MDLSERNDNNTRRHPWEVSRFQFFAWLLAKASAKKEPATILDIGSGDAWFAEQLTARLKPGSTLTCWDSEYGANQAFLASKQWPAAMTFTSEEPSTPFDRILMLDVLEHIDNDSEFLQKVLRHNLKDDGRVLVSVPTWPFLFSEHDVQLKHFRRYRPAQCRRLLQQAGLQVIREGGLFHSLFFARVATMLTDRLGTKSVKKQTLGQWEHGPLLTGALTLALTADNAFSKLASKFRLNVPGLSWWALCRKQSS